MNQNNPWSDIASPSANANLRRVSGDHVLDFRYGKDMGGRYLFVLFFQVHSSLEAIQFPKLNGIDLQFSNAMANDTMQLVLTLADQPDWEIFLALCNDLIAAATTTTDSIEAVHIVVRRLIRWRDFLKHKRSRHLSESEIKGLLGELIFLRDVIAPVFGIDAAIAFWQGPEGSPQDFNIRDSVIEVKCQSGSTAPSIHISSAEQLWPQLPEMFLYVITLGKCPADEHNAMNLPSIIQDIADQLDVLADHIQQERFGDMLHLAGYIDSEYYQEFNYLFSDGVFFKVEEGFPRIPQEAVCPGVDRLNYSIQLGECAPFKGNPTWVQGEDQDAIDN